MDESLVAPGLPNGADDQAEISSDADATEAGGAPTEAGPGDTGDTTQSDPGETPGTVAANDIPFGKGVTSDSVSIGITFLEAGSAGAFNSMFGTDIDEEEGTGQDRAQLLVEHVNARGGMAGRQVKPVYYEHKTVDLLSAEGRRRAEQEMCARFTEDNQVFAMIPWISIEGVITQCAVAADTPMIGVTELDDSVDAQRFAEIGRWWYRPNWFSAERRERALVERLVAQGFFEPGAKVGIMMHDKPVYRRGVERALKPALAEAGVTVVAEAAFPDFATGSWETYVLQFRQAGVTHVLWSHCACSSSTAGLFMRAAEDQGWRPHYGLASEYQLGALVDLWASPEQLKNARGIGWFPAYDRWPHPIDPITAADGECRAIMQKAGYDNGGSVNSGGVYCEGLFFLKAALDRAPALTSAGLASAVEGLASDYVGATTPATFFGPGRHDGAAAVWDLAFDIECECFVYTAGPHSIG